ncbi:DUF1127 domain-containing protein [Pseudogemmobacter sonorensis]|uniref:DUF1127 domain-containing protein n=1 Tax=Pseudogemmobacter sonorensis TaxID=2989681 RepID=UPI0036A7221F
MSETTTFHSPLLPAELPPLSRMVVTLGLTLALWENRRLSRRALSRLDMHGLRDIGLDAERRDAECAKPFWRD